MQFTNTGSSPLIESRPSLADTRRVSSGVGAGGSSLGHGNYRDKEDAVPVGFDEGILRGLCDMDVIHGQLLRRFHSADQAGLASTPSR
jgi:hypothetical protein